MPDCGVHYLWFAFVCFFNSVTPPPLHPPAPYLTGQSCLARLVNQIHVCGTFDTNQNPAPSGGWGWGRGGGGRAPKVPPPPPHPHPSNTVHGHLGRRWVICRVPRRRRLGVEVLTVASGGITRSRYDGVSDSIPRREYPVVPFRWVENCSKGAGVVSALFQDPPPPRGGGLLSGHYGGRRSTWDRYGDQKPQKKKKERKKENGICGISALREVRKVVICPLFDEKKIANYFCRKTAKIKAPDRAALFPAPHPPPPGVVGGSCDPSPPWGHLPPA